MTCNRITAQLDDYLDGTLRGDRRADVHAHVEGCAECRAAVAGARRLQRALRAYPVEGPSAGYFDRALAAARAASAPAARPARVWTVGISSALAAGLAVAVVGGLLLQDPELDRRASGAPGASEAAAAASGVGGVRMAMHETRTVNLVFSANTELEGVSLTVDLPPGLELTGYAGLDRIRWTTRLQPGKNVLPLELVALGGAGGELVARLRHGEEEKVFTVRVAVI
jgi:hypothetical protein